MARPSLYSLTPVRRQRDILPAYQDTPIADLLAYQNLDRPHRAHRVAELLVGMCMDHRKRLQIPDNFAHVMRTGGANLRGWEFQISFAIAVKGVRAIALVGHGQCGMADLAAKREAFVSGLVDRAGWRRDVAEEHFDEFAPRFEVGDPAGFVYSQAVQLRHQYPGIAVAPLLYSLEGGTLHQISGHRKSHRIARDANRYLTHRW